MSGTALGLGGLIRRELRNDIGPVVVLALIVLLLSGMVAAAPAAMAQIGTSEIQQSVDGLSPVDRNPRFEAGSMPPVGPAPAGADLDLPQAAAQRWGAFAADLEAARSKFPDALRAVSGRARFTVASAPLPLTDSSGGRPADKLITIVDDPYLSEHLTLTAGHWPEPGSDPTGAVQVALGESAAEQMGWPTGATRQVQTGGAITTFELVGILAQNPADTDYPKANPYAVQPIFFDDGNSPATLTATAYIPSGSWSSIPVTSGVTTTAWFPLTGADVAGADAETLAADLRQLAATEITFSEGSQTAPGVPLSSVRLSSELPGTLDAAVGRVVSASAVQTVAALGPCGAAIAVLALGLQALARRREAATGLLLARGAATAQVRRSLAVLGLTIGVPSAVIAVLGVQAMFGWNAPWWTSLLGLAAGLIPAVTLPVGAASAGLRAHRADFGHGRAASTRWVGEAAVLLLAALALYLLLSGGLTAGDGGADVLVAATPVILALAVCVLVIRLYPLILLAVQRLLRRRSGPVGYLGAARSLRDPLVGVPLILATVTGVAIAVFSVVTLSTVSRGIDASGLQQTGADLKVGGAWFTDEVTDAVRDLPGVRMAAPTGFAGSVEITSGEGSRRVDLYFTDTAAYADVVPDIPGAAQLPASMSELVDGAVPAAVSQQVADVVVGEPDVDGTVIDVVGTGVVATGLGSRPDWMLVDRQFVDQFTTSNAVSDHLLVALAKGADPAAVEAAISDTVTPISGRLSIQRPTEVSGALRAAPTIGGMQAVLVAATLLGVLLVGLAIVVTAVSGTRGRNRLLGVLRVLGFTRSQAAQLVCWEQAPPALTATLVGGGFGLALAGLIRGVVDLRSFTGSAQQPVMSLQPWWLIGVIGAFAATMVGAIVFSAVRAGRMDVTAEQRTEDRA